MAKRKVVWSPRARIRLFAILEFYALRNQSQSYSVRIYRKFNRELKLVADQPDIGILTQVPDVRGLIVENFILFYEATSTEVIVHTVWDCRQNPDDLVIK